MVGRLNFLLGWPIFRCELLVSGRVGIFIHIVFVTAGKLPQIPWPFHPAFFLPVLTGYLEKGNLVMDRRKIALRYVRTWFVPEPWPEIFVWFFLLRPNEKSLNRLERVFPKYPQRVAKICEKYPSVFFSWLFGGVGQGLMTRAANRFQMNTLQFCSTVWLQEPTAHMNIDFPLDQWFNIP